MKHDDAFGQDVRRGVEEALARRKLKPVASGRVERGSTDVTQAVRAIAGPDPQVVICGSFGKSLVEFITAMKHTQVQPQFYALSFFTAGASSFRSLNLGGMFLSYSPTDHSGLKRAEITVIGQGGQVVQ